MKRNITPLRRILKIDGGFGVFRGFNLQSRRTFDARQWLCLAAKFGFERKKGEGALEIEKKERERQHVSDRERESEKQMGFWEFQVQEAREKWRGLIYFQGVRLSFSFGFVE